MSNAEENSIIPVDATNASTLRDLVTSLRDSDISNIIQTAVHNPNSQTIFFHVQNVIRGENADRQQSSDENSAEQKIRNLSENYKRKYPELLRHFNEWKPLRLELISVLKRSSYNLKRNVSLESRFRIVTSVTDILGTLLRYRGYSGGPITNFIMDNASIIGVLAHFTERIVCKKMHSDVDEAIKKDQEYFMKLVEWFAQTRELDEAVKDFFPFGIDKDIVMKIHARSNKFDDYQKIFIAVVLSSVQKDAKLFKDVDFLRKADCFATSEAGKVWFQKEILEDEPYFSYACNSTLYDEIQAFNDKIRSLQKEMKEQETDGTKENTLEALKIMLASSVKTNVILNCITICNIFLKKEPQELNSLRKLAKSTSEELEKMDSIVRLLNPTRPQMIPVS